MNEDKEYIVTSVFHFNILENVVRVSSLVRMFIEMLMNVDDGNWDLRMEYNINGLIDYSEPVK